MKVKYGEERFCTFLIKDITFAKLMQEIKRNCSPLAHLPASNIRVRYRDEDGDMINLWDDSSGFSFGEMLSVIYKGRILEPKIQVNHLTRCAT